MKAPRCKLCGKEHYGLCSAAPKAVVVDVTHPDPKGSRRGADIRQSLLTGVPLTPAQKQAAYRERHKERVREADKLRKRKTRGVNPDSD